MKRNKICGLLRLQAQAQQLSKYSNYFQSNADCVCSLGMFISIHQMMIIFSHDNCTITIIVFTQNNVERGGPISRVELCAILLITKYKKCPQSQQLAPLLPGSRLHKTRTKYHQLQLGILRNIPICVEPRTQTRTIQMKY